MKKQKAPFYTHLMKRDTPMTEGVVSGKVTLNLKSQVEEILGASGAMLSQSKSGYSKAHPDNLVYFNACIFNEKGEQIWFGDLDLTKSEEKLLEVAQVTGKIYVTPEQPFRFSGLYRHTFPRKRFSDALLESDIDRIRVYG